MKKITKKDVFKREQQAKLKRQREIEELKHLVFHVHTGLTLPKEIAEYGMRRWREVHAEEESWTRVADLVRQGIEPIIAVLSR